MRGRYRKRSHGMRSGRKYFSRRKLSVHGGMSMITPVFHFTHLMKGTVNRNWTWGWGYSMDKFTEFDFYDAFSGYSSMMKALFDNYQFFIINNVIVYITNITMSKWLSWEHKLALFKRHYPGGVSGKVVLPTYKELYDSFRPEAIIKDVAGYGDPDRLNYWWIMDDSFNVPTLERSNTENAKVCQLKPKLTLKHKVYPSCKKRLRTGGTSSSIQDQLRDMDAHITKQRCRFVFAPYLYKSVPNKNADDDYYSVEVSFDYSVYVSYTFSSRKIELHA